MNLKYFQLCKLCDDDAENPQAVMSGDLLAFGDDTKTHRDAIWDKLFLSCSVDGLVEVVLRLLFPALAVLSVQIINISMQ